MKETLHSLKSEMINRLLAVEQMQIGTARRQAEGIAIGSSEYYGLFSPLHESDPALFAKALCELRNPYDELYLNYADEFANLYHYHSARISLHCIRLSLHFQIDLSLCPACLKHILQIANRLQQSRDFHLFDRGARVFHSAYTLLGEVLADPTVREYFFSFLSIDEVVDSQTAMVYELCYRHKAVAKCPAYVRKVGKVLSIYDRLYGIGWQMIIEKKSAQSVEGGIQLLEEVGFAELAGLLRQARDYKAAHPNAKQYPNKLVKAMDERITPDYCEETICAYLAACKG